MKLDLDKYLDKFIRAFELNSFYYAIYFAFALVNRCQRIGVNKDFKTKKNGLE